MKYIFVAGAPGSKWSSVCKNIYYSDSIDRSDYSNERTYYHDASGVRDLMHMGAYFDPGMEFGDFFGELNKYSKEDCEAEFDRPFTGEGVRIVKSHVFAHHIGYLKKNWPDCPIVLVHRPNDACLGWWVRCGQFTITYPSYDSYYKDLRHMAKQIDLQNKDISDTLYTHRYRGVKLVNTNLQLCDALGIKRPKKYRQDYRKNDITVGVL